MKSFVRIVAFTIITSAFLACSSTLHLYSGQQYLSDEELGTLQVSEQIRVYKFDRKEVQKTAKPPVIKALPGEHRLELIANTADNDSKKNPKEMVINTIFWNAVEGHTYQLTFSESDSDINSVTIIDVSNDTSL